MIRRLLAATALVLGLGLVAGPVAGAAAPASAPAPKLNAAGGDILCLYNLQPLNLGLCLSV